MMKYWPHNQSLELNNEVANLFFRTKQKFSYNLLNKTNNNLYIDLLDNSSKKKLFSIILLELEILTLDIIELDLNIDNIKLLNYKILYDLIEKSLYHFSIKIIKNNIFFKNYQSNYHQIILNEHRLLLEYLLIYIIFGSSNIDTEIFPFNNRSTPKNHISILLENLIIQISDLIMFTIFENMQSLYKITSFINNSRLCNFSYISIRSVALFRHTLVLQNFIRLYISQPKAIYSSRYKVWLISSKGLVAKYIYISRINDISILSKIQLISLFLIEIQDIFIPYLEKFFLILSKILIYVIIHLLGNSAIFCIRSILVGMNNINKYS